MPACHDVAFYRLFATRELPFLCKMPRHFEVYMADQRSLDFDGDRPSRMSSQASQRCRVALLLLRRCVCRRASARAAFTIARHGLRHRAIMGRGWAMF